MLGLCFEETMKGQWHRVDSPGVERAIEFHARGEVSRLRELLGDTVAKLSGRVVVDGLTRGTDFEGTLGLGALLREKRLPYAFAFRADDGRRYRFDGAKEVSVRELARTMTTLPAYIYDDSGSEIGRAVLHFDLRGDLVTFLRSWKPFRTR